MIEPMILVVEDERLIARDIAMQLEIIWAIPRLAPHQPASKPFK